MLGGGDPLSLIFYAFPLILWFLINAAYNIISWLIKKAWTLKALVGSYHLVTQSGGSQQNYSLFFSMDEMSMLMTLLTPGWVTWRLGVETRVGKSWSGVRKFWYNALSIIHWNYMLWNSLSAPDFFNLYRFQWTFYTFPTLPWVGVGGWWMVVM